MGVRSVSADKGLFCEVFLLLLLGDPRAQGEEEGLTVPVEGEEEGLVQFSTAPYISHIMER